MTDFNIIILIVTVVFAFINCFIMASHHSYGVENRKSLNIKFLVFSKAESRPISKSGKKKILYIRKNEDMT